MGNSLARCSRRSAHRSRSASAYPRRDSSRAIAAPIPLEPPVMMARCTGRVYTSSKLFVSSSPLSGTHPEVIASQPARPVRVEIECHPVPRQIRPSVGLQAVDIDPHRIGPGVGDTLASAAQRLGFIGDQMPHGLAAAHARSPISRSATGTSAPSLTSRTASRRRSPLPPPCSAPSP